MKKAASIFLILITLISFLTLTAYSAPAKKSSRKRVTPPDLKGKIAAIAASNCLGMAKAGIKIISLDTGQTVFEKNAYEPLIPASNMKIITSAAAFSYLKPEYQFKTILFTDGKISNGTLRGDLYIKGYGAPDLVAENIWAMMKEFCSSGIKRIEGDIIGDDTYFDPMTRPSSWPSKIDDSPYGAPISALSCNFNSVKITITPNLFGAKPFVFLFPFTDFFKISNNAVTQNSKNHLFMRRIFENGENKIVVNGSISSGSGGISDYRSVDNPTLYTLSSIRETLKSMGVEVTGTMRRGQVPSRAKQALVFKTKPLAQILYDMNKNSNNFIAEMVLKTLGAEMIGVPGTTEKGCEVAKMFMKDAGINVSNIRVLDGSGLSRGNLVTADAIVRILQHMETKFGESYEFISSFPIGGADGTLERHFRDESVARKVRAKTGYINGVKSLSGYIENRSGEKFAFAMLVNSSRCGPSQDLDDICETIALSTSLY